MNPLLGLVRDDDSWVKLIAFALFFVVPIVLRILRKIFERFGLLRTEESAELPRKTTRGLTRTLREAQMRSEREGEAMWKQLARGDALAQAPPAKPAPMPTAPRTLESESAPAPLDMLGPLSEPSDVQVVSLETEVAPEPLAMLGVQEAAPRTKQRSAWHVTRAELTPSALRRAMVLSEVLGPPVSERGRG